MACGAWLCAPICAMRSSWRICARSTAGRRATGVAHAAWPVTPVDPFFNANSPEDIDEAEALIARHGEI